MELPLFLLSADDADGVDFVSMVDQPAIERTWQAFNKQQHFKIQDAERRIVSGPLMVADLPIYRRNKDGYEFYVAFNAKAIETIALKFHRQGNGNNVNLMHDEAVQGVWMFESFLIDSKRGIKTPEGFDELPDGSWFGSYKVENEDVWAKVKDGTFKGFSVEGVFASKLLTEVDETTLEKLKQKINRTDERDLYLGAMELSKTEVSAFKKFLQLFNVSFAEKAPVATEAPVTKEAAPTEADPNDGTHIKDDGSTFTTAAGVVTIITPAQTQPTMDTNQTQPAQTQPAAQKMSQTPPNHGPQPTDSIAPNPYVAPAPQAMEAVSTVEGVEVPEWKATLEQIQNAFKQDIATLRQEMADAFAKQTEKVANVEQQVAIVAELPSDEPTKAPTANTAAVFTKDKKMERLLALRGK